MAECCAACVCQIRETAANVGLILAGENALPVFSPSGIDAVALERIVYNTRVRPWRLWNAAVLTCSSAKHVTA